MISKYVKNNGSHYSDVISKIEKTKVDDEKVFSKPHLSILIGCLAKFNCRRLLIGVCLIINVSSSSNEVTTPIKESTTIDHSGDMYEESVTKRSLAGEPSSNVAEKKLKSVIKQENE
ncbi:hypothetical protein Adt_10031 [Abeliophyllum distichum]|uniref:Uncharacterized protein n=1 Tax=Abeliophyllum distichum TaxID=126358 RepID=A0ABD1UJ59_9LAMI